jgi:hypothetical protein
MVVVWGDGYDFDVRQLQRLPSYCCGEVATLVVLLFTDVTCVWTCIK